MPITTRTFRVFVSSTFEDLKEERDALQRDVFPKLRDLCEQHGSRFQAVDLRWGVRDEAALDQQTMTICLREIRRCQATGVRPNFLVLLGDRYGWQPLPPAIPASEFEALLPRLSDDPARALASQWYRLDRNAVPPEYCLQPRTGEFRDPAAWNAIEQRLHDALAAAARAEGLPEERLAAYEASATHQEILAGLGEAQADRQHVFAFARRSDGPGDSRLEQLKSRLNVREFEPGDLDGLCRAVLASLGRTIEDEVKRFEDRSALELEMDAHERFAEERCRVFTGRRAVLNAIAKYIAGDDARPLVLRGPSGSGKSAVMAKASEAHVESCQVVRRFIGASPASSNGRALLASLCLQLTSEETPSDYGELETSFRERLAEVDTDPTLVLFIDALDQLGASDPARQLNWLPKELPEGVKIIVSTTGSAGGLVVPLGPLAPAEGRQALKEWLRESGRTLQPWQRDLVLAPFERCGLPLYLRLAAEESKLWKSYAPADVCRLGEGVAEIIDTLFDRLADEANHGPVLAGRSLGYLAAARYGLTEDEVLDVLAADDALWSDFDRRKHHEVGERRLPVVVWSRLSLDLEPYLTERAAPGGTTIAFYHRQLAERAAERFLAGTELEARHGDLARYFGGRPVESARRAAELVFHQRGAQQWAEAEATLSDHRFLAAKCLAGLSQDLDEDYRALLAEAPDEALARRETLRLMHGAVRLSLHMLARDPTQFAPQMLGRLLARREKAGLADFLEAIAVCAPRPWFRPLRGCFDSPGGPLLRTIENTEAFSVAVTPDGEHVISGSYGGEVRVWDLKTGSRLAALEGHRSTVSAVALLPDGKVAVSASEDGTLKVWDLETGSDLDTLVGHGPVSGVAVTADGRQAVSASWDNTLKVWNLKSGTERLTLEGHEKSVNAVAVTQDGKRAISGCYDGTVKVWDLTTGSVLRSFEEHTDSVRCLAITPDGKTVISGADDKTVKVWDLDSGSVRRTLEGHTDGVVAVVVTPDGKLLLSGSADHTLKVWELDNGVTHPGDQADGISQPGVGPERTLEGHSQGVTGMVVTPDGKRAVSASYDDTLKIWDLEALGDASVREDHASDAAGVAVTPDGRLAVSASLDRTLKVWNLETGRVLRTLEGHTDGVWDVAVTPDGERAVSACRDQTLKVWEMHTGRLLRTLEGHVDHVYGVGLSPDGRLAISAARDRTLKVWDLKSGRLLRTLEGHEGSVYRAAVLPDGRRMLSASEDRTLRLWDLQTGKALRTLTGHSDEVRALAVSRDGKLAVSGCEQILVWDIERGEAVRDLEGAAGGVYALALSADGKRLLSASGDMAVRIWDFETGGVISTFQCEAAAQCCAFIDQRRVIAGDEGGRVYLLALEEDAPAAVPVEAVPQRSWWKRFTRGPAAM